MAHTVRSWGGGTEAALAFQRLAEAEDGQVYGNVARKRRNNETLGRNLRCRQAYLLAYGVR
ncbi:hypothetical protein GCM10027168_28490 [Streptomyces capparidis]